MVAVLCVQYSLFKKWDTLLQCLNREPRAAFGYSSLNVVALIRLVRQ